jgi:glycosyltransferase involved in cell wall biosynthesis
MDRGADAPSVRRVLFVSHTCYLDSSNGASVASRSLMECLARHGFAAAAMTGTALDSNGNVEPEVWMAEQGLTFEAVSGSIGLIDAPVPTPDDLIGYRLRVRDVEVLLHRSPTTCSHEPDERERQAFLRLLEETLDRFRPGVVVNYGGDALAAQIRGQSRAKGAEVVFALHNFSYQSPAPFVDTDAVIVPSRFAASYYRRTLGLDCRPLPNLIDLDRVRAATRDPRFVTFVNPSYEKGVYIFARIADELGRRRSDIPLLVVEGRGTERTLVDCGLDLRARGNVNVMSHTSDPRHFWGVTRICLMPSLWRENQPLVAIEAMVNGVPVIGSDRGGIPEALGGAGIVLNLPSRLTPSTRELPTAEEVRSWVKTITGLWDDHSWYTEQSRRASAESLRWAPEVLEPLYVRFFEGLRPTAVSGKAQPSGTAEESVN